MHGQGREHARKNLLYYGVLITMFIENRAALQFAVT